MSESPYFATAESTKIAEKLVAKVSGGYQDDFTTKVRSQLRAAYDNYYVAGLNGAPGLAGLTRKGEQSELLDIRINHSRALVGALLNLVIAPQLVWQAKATNVDYEALQEVRLAASTLEYYWSAMQVKAYAAKAVEAAIALLEGYILVEWDKAAGEIVAPDLSIPGKVLRAGDIKLRNLFAWEVHRDPAKRSFDDLDWVIVETPHNRYDLAARYPNVAQRIVAAGKEIENTPATHLRPSSGDDLTVYRFLHKPCEVLPWGREVRFLADGTLLSDESCEIWPLHRVVPAELIGTPYGYSPYLEILGLQELYDNLSSAIATNQTNFAVQNIALTQGSVIQPEELSGGMRIIEVPIGGEVKPLQLTASPQEVFGFLKDLKTNQELLVGLNATVRGEVASEKLSGSAMALLQSQALQQSGVLQANYVRMVEQLGTTIIQFLQKHADVPRKIALVGRSSSHVVSDAEISGKSFGRVQRVTVEVGNPLAQTAAGRSEIAKELLQMKLIQTPEQYQQVLLSGRLEPLTQGTQDELMNIASENEDMAAGITPQVLISADNHLLHGREHRTVVSNPKARKDPKVIAAYMAHMKQHYAVYFGVPVEQVEMDPLYRDRMLILGGQTPPPPMRPPGMMPPPGQGGPDGSAPPGNAPPPPPGTTPSADQPSMPKLPENPGVDPSQGVPQG